MLDQHTQRSTNTRRTPAEPWCDPAVRALRRAQPPPTSWPVQVRHERGFWCYLGAAAVLAALVPVTIVFVLNVVDSVSGRLLVAFVAPALAAVAVTASAAASRAASIPSHRERRTSC